MVSFIKGLKLLIHYLIVPNEWDNYYQRIESGDLFKQCHQMDTVYMFDQASGRNTLIPVIKNKKTGEIKSLEKSNTLTENRINRLH